MREKINGISLRKFCSRVELGSVTLDFVSRQTLNLYLELCAGSWPEPESSSEIYSNSCTIWMSKLKKAKIAPSLAKSYQGVFEPCLKVLHYKYNFRPHSGKEKNQFLVHPVCMIVTAGLFAAHNQAAGNVLCTVMSISTPYQYMILLEFTIFEIVFSFVSWLDLETMKLKLLCLLLKLNIF